MNNRAAEKWEQRKARRLLYKFFLVTFISPLLVFICCLIYVKYTGVPLTKEQIKTIVAATWLSSLIVLVISALRSMREQVVYITDDDEQE